MSSNLNFNGKDEKITLIRQRSKSVETTPVICLSKLNLINSCNSSIMLAKKVSKPVPTGPLLNHCYIPMSNSIYDPKHQKKINKVNSITQQENISYNNVAVFNYHIGEFILQFFCILTSTHLFLII